MSNKKIIRKLVRNILFIIFIIITIIISLRYIYDDFFRTNLAQAYLNDASSRAEEQFANLYRPIVNTLSITRKWGISGLLNYNDVPNLNAKFIPFLEQASQIHSIKIASTNGDFYSLSRKEKKWITHTLYRKDNRNQILFQSWTGNGEMILQKTENATYNHMERPWFKGAIDSIKNDQIFWTKPRFIESAQSPGLTASVQWQDQTTSHRSVIAFDILLKDIFYSISNLKISDSSKVFLYRDDGTIFNLSISDSHRNLIETSPRFFVDHRQVKRPLLSAAIDHWLAAGMTDDDPIHFKKSNINYWVGFKPIDREHIDLWIGIVVPEKDFMFQIEQKQASITLYSLIVLFFGLILIVFIIRRYRNNLLSEKSLLSVDDDFENNLNALLQKGEGHNIEFKSTIRMNIKTGESGKEIEMAWLKTAAAFLNSNGGILLFGINDMGEIVGIEPDNFENEDKCQLHFKNLINQHIGAEFTSYLNFQVSKINDKMIAFLECSPSKKPTFLKNRGEEIFYIRSGPSSIKLPTSKMFEYIENRKS